MKANCGRHLRGGDRPRSAAVPTLETAPRRVATKVVVILVCFLASASASAQPYQVLAHFNPDAGSPRAKLLLASDGFLYGTTSMGGDFGQGSVFRIHPHGAGLETVASFQGGDGSDPNAELTEVAGFLYGTTTSGGGAASNPAGTIFRIDLSTVGSGSPAVFEVLHSFDYSDPADGGFPAAGLLARNGLLYGTTRGGGAGNAGTIFSLDPRTSPTGFAVLHSFSNQNVGDPRIPVDTLVEANGALYGVTQAGGLFDLGTLFRYDPTSGGLQAVADLMFPRAGLLAVGTDLYGTEQQGAAGYGTIFRFDTTTDSFNVVHSFGPNNPANGLFPAASLMQMSNGHLYGTTEGGGLNGLGVVFEVDIANQTVGAIHSFVANVTGSRPVAGLVEAGGLLYGTTSDRGPGGNGTVFSINPANLTVSVLHPFGPTGPVRPIAEPILGPAGRTLIGTSYVGGGRRSGTVFEWDAGTSTVRVVHSFDPDVDGAHPLAPVILASDGRLYGTTWLGGPTTCGVGCTTTYGGTVFRMDPTGANFTILRSFGGNTPGAFAPGRLLEVGGFLYGVLAAGGAHQAGGVFRVDLSSGAVQSLHEFDAAVEGSTPVAGLTLGTDGLLYGTTTHGGPRGGGTVFRMDTSGHSVEVLHQFDFANPIGGLRPESELVQVGPDVFMGTTTYGGLHASAGASYGGTVYKLDVSTSPPTFVSLRSFEDCCTAPTPYGTSPAATLAKGAGGWLYGMNRFGGPSSFHGTIFAITANGTIRLLHQFTSGDGSAPKGRLLIASDGALYGTTEYGGDGFGGVLFRFSIDSDGDNVLDPADNCPTLANPAQTDGDGDGIGDGCTNLDTDGDGVPNAQDNCPFTPNANQSDNDNDGQGDVCDTDDDNDGHSDADETACGADPLNAASTAPDRDGDRRPDCIDADDDNDGAPDATDNCPLTHNPTQANADGDALGDACDPDDDNDGVADASDNCPLTANPDQADTDADGSGNACDTDDDGDGVADGSDNCPLVPNASQADADHDGVGDACDSTPRPDRTIVFSGPSGTGFVRIFKMQADGSNVTALTSSAPFYSEDREPALSPDGSQVVFTRASFGGWDIYRMNVDGSALMRLTGAGFGIDGQPAWSPDGTRIAFSSLRFAGIFQLNNAEILVMDADGSNVRRLTTHSAQDSYPVWSPDGTKIAFASNRFGNFEILVMNADGSGVTRLTSHSATDVKPTWSPDGARIAFMTTRHGTSNYEIYSMNAADGTGLVRLTNRPGHDVWPAWGPSDEILFTSVLSGTGNWHVHKMNADGSGVTVLPAGIDPHW